MGSGASAFGADEANRSGAVNSSNINLTRLRKSLLIRAYNVRNQSRNAGSQLTLEDQFRPYAFLKKTTSFTEPHVQLQSFVITLEGIKQCLALDGDGRDCGTWVDDLCKYSLGADNVKHHVQYGFPILSHMTSNLDI